MVETIEISSEADLSWQQLRAHFLPFCPDTGIWAYSFPTPHALPLQGWKLHISATILNAKSILKLVGPKLVSGGWSFKSTRSLEELKKINCGLFYGYSQIGKFITVYSRTDDDFLELLKLMQETIPAEYSGPNVPSDIKVPGSNCLYFRYGSFKANQQGGEGGFVLGPDGTKYEDSRERKKAIPFWKEDPLRKLTNGCNSASESSLRGKLATRYLVYEALSQRGKGGVYMAIDVYKAPALLTVLKEGRSNGETDWSGRDGRTRIINEYHALKAIVELGINVPRAYDLFTYPNHCFLAMEFIKGAGLDQLAFQHGRALGIDDSIFILSAIARQVSILHSSMIAWRDLKPMNIRITSEGSVYLLDFEGSIQGEPSNNDIWGSPGFTPPEWLNSKTWSDLEKHDTFAFGATMYAVISGRLPKTSSSIGNIGSMNKKLPSQIRALIYQLLSPNPTQRPSIAATLSILEEHNKRTRLSARATRIIKALEG